MHRARSKPPAPAVARAALVVWLALAGLALARGALAFVPSMSWWGLNAQRFLDPVTAWAPWALAAATLVPPVGRPVAAGLGWLGDAIARRPLASALGWAAAAALLAWALPDRVRFIGDSLLLQEALEAETISLARWAPWSHPLDVALHQGFVRVVRDALTVEWSAATRVLGALEAGLLGAVATRFAASLGLRGVGAASAAAIVLCGGWLCLFTGYGKSLMDLVLLTAVVGTWGLARVREGRGAIAIGLAAAAGFALHRSSVALIPALVAAWVLAPRSPGAPRPDRARAWATAILGIVLPLGVLGLMARSMLAAFLRGDRAVHFPAADSGGFLAAALSAGHLLDVANLVLLLTPLALAVPALLVLDRSWRSREGMFLLALLLPYAGEMLLVHPNQGIFRDVDVFAAAGMALALLVAWLVGRALAAAPAHGWVSAAAVLGVAVPAVHWMWLASDLDRGFARVRAFAAEPPPRTDVVLAQTWDFLGRRYMKLERWERGAEALEQAARHAPSARILTQWAICEMKRGDYAAAHTLYERVLEKKPDDGYAWHELAVTSLALGRLDQARRAAREMQRLDPADDTPRIVFEEIARREAAGGPP